MSGRTYWLMKDSAWWGREWIVDLGEEHGTAGPACIDWLECAAKAQNDQGHVKAGFRALARGVFSDVVTVRNVVLRAVTLQLLVDYEEENGIFKCLISWWHADQKRGLTAERVARSRERSGEDVTLGNAEALHVTRRGEEKEEAKASSSAQVRVDREKRLSTEEDRASCKLFFTLGRKRNEKMIVPKDGTGDWASALSSMRKLRTSDDNTADEINRLIEWVFTADHKDAVFWGTTIQAPSGLRDNFAKVWSKMAAAGSDPAAHVNTVDDLMARDEAARAARKAA